MDICGNIYVAKDIKTFSLKCLYCDTNVSEWFDFMNHIQTSHNPLDENWIDPLIEDNKEEILIEEIKQELDIDVRDSLTSLNNEISIEINIATKEEEDANDSRDSNPKDEDDQDAYMLDYTQEEDTGKCSGTEDANADGDTLKSTTKFNPTFFRRNSRTIEFIRLYKTYPCLWNPNDENYRNFPIREEAHKKMRETMRRKFHVILTERAFQGAIKKLRKQYVEILQIKDQAGSRYSAVAKEYFEECSFLSVFEENPEEITNDSDSHKLIFTKLNDVTQTFIETYAHFPALYNPKHNDYNNFAVRKQAYQDMIANMKDKCNAVFTEDDIYKSIYALRQWYYKTQSRARNNKMLAALPEAQRFFVKKCKFLPPKQVKVKLPCEMCNEVYANESTLQVHMYKKHQIGELPHKCPDCERSFEQKSMLIMHQQRNHVGKIHQCEYCERRFAVPIDLRRHIRTHTGERPFVCEQCGKAFPSKTQLGYHMDAVHLKHRAYKCTMCPKDFLKSRDLRDHIKAHLNIRDKICETCGKGFTNCHSLIRHRQIHSEVKKFACKLCDAKFHQFVGLNAHMKRTHNIVKKSA